MSDIADTLTRRGRGRGGNRPPESSAKAEEILKWLDDTFTPRRVEERPRHPEAMAVCIPAVTICADALEQIKAHGGRMDAAIPASLLGAAGNLRVMAHAVKVSGMYNLSDLMDSATLLAKACDELASQCHTAELVSSVHPDPAQHRGAGRG